MKQWDDFLIGLKRQLGQATLDRWLLGLKVEKYDARNIHLVGLDSFQISWFKEHILPIASKKLLNHQKRPYKISIRQKSEKILKPQKTSKPIVSSSYYQLPVRQNFQLDNFIVTEQNLLTVQVLKQFCKSLSTKTQTLDLEANPIFLFGDTGSGKTHLLQALYKEFIRNNYNPIYVTAALFTEHFVKALRSNDIAHFRKFYRSFDVLIVDDIDVFSQKIATQEEFFHTFNTYHSFDKPVILSSKTPAKELTDIEPRLVSRFEWGLPLSISPLSTKNFKNFIDLRCKELNISLESLSVNYLLTKVTHILDLDKILQMLSLKQSLHYQGSIPLSLNVIQDIVEKTLERSKQNFSNEKLLQIVSDYFNLDKQTLTSSLKTRQLVYPRRLCMYLMRKYGKKPFGQIGKFFAKDHSTIMTSIQAVEEKISQKDKTVIEDLNNLILQAKKKPN